MKLLSILFTCLLLCCFACSKEKINARTTTDCPLIADVQVIPEDEIPCNYNSVYRYKGELYTHCYCCLCNKWAPPVNCEGKPLCRFPDSCWDEFQEKAEYLFAIEEF